MIDVFITIVQSYHVKTKYYITITSCEETRFHGMQIQLLIEFTKFPLKTTELFYHNEINTSN